MNDVEEELAGWMEDATSHFVSKGWPPIMARSLAWLMVCDPQEQSPARIAEAVGASRASLTSTLRVLTTSGLARAVVRPGDRTTYYRLTDEAWATSWRQQMSELKRFADLARGGMEILGEDSPRAARVREAYELYEFLSNEAGPLWDRWLEWKRDQDGER
ncbi:MAG TPA: transcriptional regulator [Stackebrandtia sp.]|jgi:DNA-binding transcriptional regulator GbsR (MarR family)|uniref:GbsR/MarR family transcriptional regulator n=1 Tax=Stackebrandtia sp. TaxID=2023065 RepID=UPI002D41BF0B|nr:transcriptional regulator [Stackebrandtia sp.]HZE38187.1 transcriptional regulator [Stackebrandtia sp.]